MTACIYVAAPLPAVLKARALAARLTALEHTVVSTWHVEVKPGDVDPVEAMDRENALMMNFAQVRDCDMLVAYLANPELPRTTFGEVGFAYALGKLVLMALPPGQSPNRCLLNAHPLCTEYTSDEQLEETVTAALARRVAPVRKECATCAHWMAFEQTRNYVNDEVWNAADLADLKESSPLHASTLIRVNRLGLCKRANGTHPADPTSLAIADDGGSYFADLRTAATFGCVMWEAKT